jgi:hypothetical protein
MRLLRLFCVALASLLPAGAEAQERPISAMLRAVPAAVMQGLAPSAPELLSYSRFDRLAGAAGPAAAPGATRAEAVMQGWPVALRRMPRLLQGGGAEWPRLVGFDLDAVGAVLVLHPFTAVPGSVGLRVLSGAPRLTDAAALARALERRGFARLDGPVFSRGADNAIDILARDPDDPFDDGLGRGQRLAPTSAGLLVANDTRILALARATLAGRHPSLADIAPMRALLDALDEAAVVQAQVFGPWALVSDPAAALGVGRPVPLPFGAGGPSMPRWSLAAIAEYAPEDGVVPTRLVLVTPTPREAMETLVGRLERGMAAAERPYRLLGVSASAGEGIVVVNLRPARGAEPRERPLHRWLMEMEQRVPVPFAIGAVPAAAAAPARPATPPRPQPAAPPK